MSSWEKCKRCGFLDGNRYHVCIDPTPADQIPRVDTPYEERVIRSKRTTPMDDADKAKLSEIAKARWSDRNRERNKKVVERYSEGGVSYVKLAEEFGISRSTVIKIMKEASAAGMVELRSPGLTIRHGA